MSALISTAELAAKLGSANLVILNASWHMPAEKRDARAEHAQGHIPGALFFDIDAISDTASPYPHMLPDATSFERAVGALGIGNGAEIVVYDAAGLFSAARVWWMFRVFGHDAVKLLDGGLPKWQAEKRPVEQSARPPATAAVFKARYRPELVRDYAQIKANTLSQAEQLIDARSAGRFEGSEPEPRAGLASGHIAGSVNIPFRGCTAAPYHTLKPEAELRQLFTLRGVDISKPTVASCGSGVTACVLALALYELGRGDVAVYDGAWAEWGSKVGK